MSSQGEKVNKVTNKLKNIGNTIANNLAKNKKFVVIVLVVLAIFITLAYYIYTNYISPKIQPLFKTNNEFTQDQSKETGSTMKPAFKQVENENMLPPDTKGADLYFFYANWCPFSKKAKPVVEQIMDEFQNKLINNYHLVYKMIDDENEAEITRFETTYNEKVGGYPTVFLIKNDEVIEYDAKITPELLKQFITSVLR